MIYAYRQEYLPDALQNLGGMLDFAVNDCKYNVNDFLKRFIIAGVLGCKAEDLLETY